MAAVTRDRIIVYGILALVVVSVLAR